MCTSTRPVVVLARPSLPRVKEAGSSTVWNGRKQPNSNSPKNSCEPRKRHIDRT
ncbi:hypothetical protein D3C77_607630 [compost metagenome]